MHRLLDTNMDGFIDRGEMRRAMPEARDEELTRVMKECDLDGDGKVEADEWVAYVLRTQQGCDEATFVEGVHNLCVLLEAPLKTAIEAAFTAADKDGRCVLAALVGMCAQSLTCLPVPHAVPFALSPCMCVRVLLFCAAASWMSSRRLPSWGARLSTEDSSSSR